MVPLIALFLSCVFAACSTAYLRELFEINHEAALQLIRDRGMEILGESISDFVNTFVRYRAFDLVIRLDDPNFWRHWAASKEYEVLINLFSRELKDQITVSREKILSGQLNPLALPSLLRAWSACSVFVEDVGFSGLLFDVMSYMVQHHFGFEDSLALSQTCFRFNRLIRPRLRAQLMRIELGFNAGWKLSLYKIYKLYASETRKEKKAELFSLLKRHQQFNIFSEAIVNNNGTFREFDALAFPIYGLSWNFFTVAYCPLIRALLYRLQPDIILILLKEFENFMLYRWDSESMQYIIDNCGGVAKYRRLIGKVVFLVPIEPVYVIWACQKKHFLPEIINQMVEKIDFTQLGEFDIASLINEVNSITRLEELLNHIDPNKMHLKPSHILHFLTVGISDKSVTRLLTEFKIIYTDGISAVFISALLKRTGVNRFLIEGFLRTTKDYLYVTMVEVALATELGYNPRVVDLLKSRLN